MDIGITKMSTKGQIVVPADMRKEYSVGEKLIIIKKDSKLIIKKASEMDEELIDDLEFAKQTEEAYQQMEQGKFTKMEFDEFTQEMKKW